MTSTQPNNTRTLSADEAHFKLSTQTVYKLICLTAILFTQMYELQNGHAIILHPIVAALEKVGQMFNQCRC